MIRQLWLPPKTVVEIYLNIIKKGANVNYQNTKGETALIRAVMKGAKDNVKILIENNADINLKDKNGNTAMDYAQKSNYNEIVKILKNAK